MRGLPCPLQRTHCTSRSATRMDASGSRGLTRRFRSLPTSDVFKLARQQSSEPNIAFCGKRCVEAADRSQCAALSALLPKADMWSATRDVRDHTHDRGHNQCSSTSRAIPTRSRHTQAAIDSLVIARRRIAEIPRLCCLAWAARNCAASIASSKSLHL
jgi:hypothetical protein